MVSESIRQTDRQTDLSQPWLAWYEAGVERGLGRKGGGGLFISAAEWRATLEEEKS